jgi:diguanylate cyclase (GGDEF)-like protein
VESTVCNIAEDPLGNSLLLHTRDVSERKKAEEQAAHSQLFDTLITKLPNISLLKTRLQLEIVKVQERSQKNIFAVMSIGVDNFKKINNLYGTDAGDLLLYKIGQRLKNSFRGDDLVAHYSGDSFIVLLSYIAQSYDFKDIIRKTLGRFEEPFDVEGKNIGITACIGIAVFPTDGDFVEQLINNSQAAMYRAKGEGPGNYHLFDSRMHQELIESLQLEDELKDAVINDEFVAYYQPKFDSDEEIVGVETLIRWKSPKRGLIPPGSFVPLIEKNGMIVEIGYMILRMACEDIKRWNDRGFKKSVAINFAPAQFKDMNLIENVERIIYESGVNTEFLEFEITESGIMENAKEGLLKLFKIRSMGVSIAMDDFGTGLSSLSNLISYPIDVLKIDKSFVDKLPHNEEAKIVVNSIISLADNLGYDVVAEGIETESQLKYLKDMKCGMFQGYYFDRPMPAGEFEKKYIGKK